MNQITEWMTDLATGDATIDQQHQELFAQIGAFLTACKENLGAAQIGLTLVFLEDYVHFHFSEEAAYMDKINYPGILEHTEMHASFVNSFEELEQQLGEFGPTEEVQELARTMLIDWLVNHIQKVDKELVTCGYQQ